MIDVDFDFQKEIAKFFPSLEVGDVEDTINNMDMTDAVDLFVKMVKESDEEEDEPY